MSPLLFLGAAAVVFVVGTLVIWVFTRRNRVCMPPPGFVFWSWAHPAGRRAAASAPRRPHPRRPVAAQGPVGTGSGVGPRSSRAPRARRSRSSACSASRSSATRCARTRRADLPRQRRGSSRGPAAMCDRTRTGAIGHATSARAGSSVYLS